MYVNQARLELVVTILYFCTGVLILMWCINRYTGQLLFRWCASLILMVMGMLVMYKPHIAYGTSSTADPWNVVQQTPPVEVPIQTSENYRVVSGDSLWSIAQSHAQTPQDVITLWKSMIDINKERVQSGNVNLIYPGEIIEIP